MRPKKCPRCELNYILNNDPYCKVCMEEVHGSIIDDEIELCGVCYEHPVILGKDICSFCYREMNKDSGLSDEDFDEDENPDEKKEDDELPELEVDEIADDLVDEVDYISLDELEEEEEEAEEEDDE